MDLTGKTFNRLTVVGFAGILPTYGGKRRSHWDCRCKCGTLFALRGDYIKNGHTKSCGCLAVESLLTRSLKHGHSVGRKPTKLYRTWKHILSRCDSKTDRDYHRYGAAGITVCERWHDFELFAQDIGEPPIGNYSIERKNNQLGYSPDNCCWATPMEQANNRRSSRFLEHNGERLTVSQWGRKTGLGDKNITNRLRDGWSFMEALEKPVMSYNNPAFLNPDLPTP